MVKQKKNISIFRARMQEICEDEFYFVHMYSMCSFHLNYVSTTKVSSTKSYSPIH